MIGVERLALQGMSMRDISVANLHDQQGHMQKLAGDMFNLISYGVVLDSILACLRLPMQ